MGGDIDQYRHDACTDDVYEEARSQFSEKELIDLSIAVAMINAWNCLCIAARVAHPSDLAKAA